MSQGDFAFEFKTQLLRPAKPGTGDLWAFVVLPGDASQTLPRRGRTTIEGTINGQPFQVTLEPDGQKSHWMRISPELQEAAGADPGDLVQLKIRPVAEEPEPEIPADLQEALSAEPEALAVWHETTTIARLDWIHWVTSAKQAKTRVKRIRDACDMLGSGKKRVCCFDPSGVYSKAFKAPEAAD
jgi:hypothetical protein